MVKNSFNLSPPLHPHFYRPCTLISRWVAWASNCHVHKDYNIVRTLDLNRESHRKRKEIKMKANIDFAESNLKLWILFKVIVSNPFEHEQSILCSQGVRTRPIIVNILICRGRPSNNLECLSSETPEGQWISYSRNLVNF